MSNRAVENCSRLKFFCVSESECYSLGSFSWALLLTLRVYTFAGGLGCCLSCGCGNGVNRMCNDWFDVLNLEACAICHGGHYRFMSCSPLAHREELCLILKNCDWAVTHWIVIERSKDTFFYCCTDGIHNIRRGSRWRLTKVPVVMSSRCKGTTFWSVSEADALHTASF